MSDPTGCPVPDTNSGGVSALAACFGIGNIITAAVVKSTPFDPALFDTLYTYLERLPVREVIPYTVSAILHGDGDTARGAEIESQLVSGASKQFVRYSLEFQDIVI